MGQKKTLLIVVATFMEAAPLINEFDLKDTNSPALFSAQRGRFQLDLLITGIGMVNTALQLGGYLAVNQVDMALNYGIAGSFSKDLDLGEVVEVSEEIYGELGAEDEKGFLKLEEMGFLNFEVNENSYYNRIINPSIPQSELKQVCSLTVNKVHGRVTSISEIKGLWNADIENMEGAAFFQAALTHQVPFVSFRGISNWVESRNKENWEIKKALEQVSHFVINWIKRYLNNED